MHRRTLPQSDDLLQCASFARTKKRCSSVLKLKLLCNLSFKDGQNHDIETTIADHVGAYSEMQLLRERGEEFRFRLRGESVLRRVLTGENCWRNGDCTHLMGGLRGLPAAYRLNSAKTSVRWSQARK